MCEYGDSTIKVWVSLHELFVLLVDGETQTIQYLGPDIEESAGGDGEKREGGGGEGGRREREGEMEERDGGKQDRMWKTYVKMEAEVFQMPYITNVPLVRIWYSCST